MKRAAPRNLAITVNIMDMDFDASGDWGKALVRAAKAMLAQMRKVYPKATTAEQYRRLSITIMIGRNDNGVITQSGDAQTVLEFAKANGVGRLGIWSLGRDLGSCTGQVEAQPDCSGIAQADYQFTRQLAGYTGPRPPDQPFHRRRTSSPPPRANRASQHRVDLGAVVGQRGDREAELVLVQARRAAPAAAARGVEHGPALQLGAPVVGPGRDGPRARRTDGGLRVPS